MVTVMPVCCVDADNAEIRRKTKLCYQSLEAGCTWEMSATPRNRVHICKEQLKRLKYTQKSVSHRMKKVVLLRNYGNSILEISPVRINAIVTAITM